MSTYDFVCVKCNKQTTINCYMRDYQSKKIVICDECGGDVIRDYKKVNTIGTDGKSNPLSPNNWTVGKTQDEIADIISDETKDPY